MNPLSIQIPFPVFQDRDGQPLDNGYVWLGTANLNPQTNPVVAYFDAALTIIAAQPLRTINGYISRAGSPAQIYVDGVNFSILVQDSKGSMVYSFPDGTGISPNASGVAFTGFKGQVGFVSDLADDDGSNWIGFNPAAAAAIARSAQDKMRETVSVKDFGAVGDGVTNDTAAIQNAVDFLTYGGGTVYLPPGTYLVDTIVFPYDRGPTNTNPYTTINLIGSGMTSSILLMNNPANPVIAMSRAVANFRMTGSTFSDFAVKAHPSGSVGNSNHIAIDAVGFDAVIFRRIKFMSNGSGSVCMMFRTSAQPQLTYSQVFEGIVSFDNVGPAYIVKTQGNGIDALSNTNILQIRDCWIYNSSDMLTAFELSSCSLYQVINCEIESAGNYGITCGSRGTIIGNWFEAVAIAPIEFVSGVAGSSSQNTIMGNYFSGFSGAIVQPSTDNTGNIFINNTGGNWTLTGPAKKYVIGAGASPAAPVVTKTFGGAGTLTLVAANLVSIMDQSYELLYTFLPSAPGNFGFTVTPSTGYLNVKMTASAYDGANGVPYACAVEYPNTGFLVTAPNTNLVSLNVQVTAQ